eukprot:6202828-Pleurochrysis_carterae.AAC.6
MSNTALMGYPIDHIRARRDGRRYSWGCRRAARNSPASSRARAELIRSSQISPHLPLEMRM